MLSLTLPWCLDWTASTRYHRLYLPILLLFNLITFILTTTDSSVRGAMPECVDPILPFEALDIEMMYPSMD